VDLSLLVFRKKKPVFMSNSNWKTLWNGNECGKNEGNENLKATIPNEKYDRSKGIGECGIFQLFG
jgi:hypothetical protein